MKRGIGMWIMSKMVLLIFILGLVFVMSLFLNIYQDKVIADTAKSYTVLWSEIASGALLYESSLDSSYLDDDVRVQDANRDYTVVVEKVYEDRRYRVVFLIAWQTYETIQEIIAEGGFAAASVLNMPAEVKEVKLFKGSMRSPGFREAKELVLNPSMRVDRHTNLIFFRNHTIFCIGSVAGEGKLKEAIAIIGICCAERSKDPRCSAA